MPPIVTNARRSLGDASHSLGIHRLKMRQVCYTTILASSLAESTWMTFLPLAWGRRCWGSFGEAMPLCSYTSISKEMVAGFRAGSRVESMRDEASGRTESWASRWCGRYKS
ncbi:hypothetical protein IG631_00284 [Alternaria alternata]|nr:hypothetical protein IG631_00284 [Alternaria alternata]